MGSLFRPREPVERHSRGRTHMEWISSKRRRMALPKYVPVVLFVLVFAYFLIEQVRNYSVFIVSEDDFDRSIHVSQLVRQDPGMALHESIKRARRVVSNNVFSGSPLQELSAEGLNAWNDQYPCQSRGPDGLLSFYNEGKDPAENSPAKQLWDKVFEEYSGLHRECTQKIGDIGDYFLQKNVSSGCKFVVADVADGTDFGDKILVLASSLLYAILTQRVILVPGSSLVPSYMCEPFVGSSWLLNSSNFPLPPTSKELWKLDREIFRGTDWHRRGCSLSQYAASWIGTHQWQPQQRFYCTLEQAAYSEATFVYFSGLVYSIPKLFATPTFRPALEALFPDRIVITHLLRSAFLPGNAVWKRVRALYHGYLGPAHRHVGIEVSYDGERMPSYKWMNKIITRRITDCLIQNDILPNITHTWEARPVLRTSPTPVFRVLISSLYLDLKDHLARMYERNPTSTGDAVGVVQVSQSANQQFTLEADIEAFKEALLLSFSDQLLVTPKSTLGSVAQSYGALIPWFIDVRQDGWLSKYGTCERGQTIEVCNPYAEKKYSDKWSHSSVDGKFISDVVPYIKNCITIDHEDGLQLMSGPRASNGIPAANRSKRIAHNGKTVGQS